MRLSTILVAGHACARSVARVVVIVVMVEGLVRGDGLGESVCCEGVVGSGGGSWGREMAGEDSRDGVDVKIWGRGTDWKEWVRRQGAGEGDSQSVGSLSINVGEWRPEPSSLLCEWKAGSSTTKGP